MKPILVAVVAVSALTVGVIAERNYESVVVKKPYDENLNKGGPKGAGATILYHGGPVLLNTVPLYIIYYGMVPLSTQDIINTFLADLNGSTPFAVNKTYTQGTGGPAISGLLGFPGVFLDSGASQGTSVGSNTVTQIIQHASIELFSGRPEASNRIPCCRRSSTSHSGKRALCGLVSSGSSFSRAFNRKSEQFNFTVDQR